MSQKSVFVKKQNLTIICVCIIGLLVCLLNGTQLVVIGEKTKKSNAVDYEESCTRIRDAYCLMLEKQVESYKEQLTAYVESDAVKTGDTKKIDEWLVSHTQLHSSDFDYISYGTDEGLIYTDVGKISDVKDRSYFINVMQKGALEDVDDPVTSKTTGQSIIHVTKAIRNDTKNTGYICGVVGIDTLQKMVNSIKLGNSGFAFLLAGDGTVIAHKDKKLQLNKNFITGLSEEQKEMGTIAAKMVAQETGTAWITENGVKEFVAYAPVEGTPWSLALCVTKSQIYYTANCLSSLMILIGVIMDIILMTATGFIIYKKLNPLKNLNTSINTIATGNADLTKRIKVQSADEIGSVVFGFNTFTEKLQEIIANLKKSKDVLFSTGEELHTSTENTSAAITQILANIQSVSTQITNQSGSVEETSSAVNQIATNIASLERMIQTQSAGVTQASAAIEEMVGNISSVNDSMQKMATSFDALQKDTQLGITKQDGINVRIDSISDQSKMLQEANQVIESIASQTNLLAMNAAIEAAHAGEAGKGFSVVADEIRKLSETSTVQSKTIGNELRKIEDSIDEVVTVAKETKDVFTGVSLRIKDTGILVEQIKSAMSEQHEGSKQINQALHDMNDGTSEVRSAAEEMAAGNKAILDEVKRLQDATEIMKESMSEMTTGAKKINDTGTMLREISGNMESTIVNIGQQVDLFKV